MANFTELLYKRKSIREFNEYAIKDEEINLLLEAATRAPNACNFQSWHFYAITNKQMMDAFYPEICGSKWITTASMIIVVCTDADRLQQSFGDRGSNLFAVQDTAAAITNILLQAADIGLGGCWIGPFSEEKCRELLNLPAAHRPIALLPIGQPKSEPNNRDRRPLADVVTLIK